MIISLTRTVPALLMLAVLGQSPAGADAANPLTDLVDAAAQRLQIAEPVAAVKWITGTAIEDPDRVRQQLAALAADAAAGHLDPAYVTRVFTDQIRATEAVQYRRFAEWKLDPSNAPTTAPELSVSRAEIDNLNSVMIGQIRSEWPLLHSPGCTTRLDAALRDTRQARGLDAFYQQALSFATGSYCQP